TKKLVQVDELAAEFQLPIEDTIARLKHLTTTNHLTGLLDDRGRFFYITPSEMSRVAEFVKSRGRVTKGELARACNEIIRFPSSSSGNGSGMGVGAGVGDEKGKGKEKGKEPEYAREGEAGGGGVRRRTWKGGASEEDIAAKLFADDDGTGGT
ncbi:DDRGK domain-containing protein 1, partial [Quaeritorhiza haematococci]